MAFKVETVWNFYFTFVHLADFKLPALFILTLKAHNYQGGTKWQLILKLGCL